MLFIGRKSARALVSDRVGKEWGDMFYLAGLCLPARQVISSPFLFSTLPKGTVLITDVAKVLRIPVGLIL